MEFVQGIFSQVILACERDGTVDKISEDFMLSVITQMKPTDQVEAMHACQMALVHTQAMKYGRELANAKTIAYADIAANILNKLVRTFGDQTERLKRYRSGEKNVTVQNVSVSDGGQAIVGNVTQNAGSGNNAKAAVAPPALTDARATPMQIIEPNKEPVPAAHKKGARQ